MPELIVRPSVKSQFANLVLALGFIFLGVRGFSFEYGLFLYIGKLSAGVAIFLCLIILVNIYNYKYVLGDDVLQCTEGILALNMTTQKIKYRDVKLVETKQNILGRILGFGDVLVGSAATSQIEVTLRNVADPELVKEFILKKISQKRTEEKSDNKYNASSNEASNG